MKPTSPYIHPQFKLNGLSFQGAEEVLNFVEELQEQGDDFEVSMANFLEQWLNFSEFINVNTSGSTGKPKTIQLLKSQMVESARATGAYFKVGAGTKALLCLSANFIAGKMMLVRAIELGWDLHVVAPEKDALIQYDNPYDFVAVVPYQLHYAVEALSKIKKIIIGGGALSPQLEEALQNSNLEAFATYGMTETITHIAARRLNGFAKSNYFHALPNVKFSIDHRNCLVIEAPKICKDVVVTNDIVSLQSPTSFKWLGRYDFIINSGGIKINPEEVEQKLAKYILQPFIVSSEQDDLLGEKLVLVVEDKEEHEVNYQNIFIHLESYQRPKKVYTLSKFPYTESGKIKRLQLKQIIQKFRK